MLQHVASFHRLLVVSCFCFFFFFQEEDGIRDVAVTGVQTCASSDLTLGGWIATGGTGIGAYKYGTAGDLIRDMEVVLPTGIMIHTGDKHVPSSGGGPNLNWLFVGSEGTYGIVTEVTFSILPKPEELRPVAYSFDDLAKFSPALKKLVRRHGTPMTT